MKKFSQKNRNPKNNFWKISNTEFDTRIYFFNHDLAREKFSVTTKTS